MLGAKAAAYTAANKKAFKTSPGVWRIFTYGSASLLFSRIA